MATRSMWAPAVLAGHSEWFDLTRMVEFDAAIRSGDFLPAWSPDFYFGYGSPLFQFYAPLAYYFTEIPVLAGLGFATALKVTQFAALFASGLAMYRLAVTYFSGWAACLGGVFYMLAPYRLVDIFVRHALAEHCAFIWLPLIIWGTERFVSQRGRIGLIIGLLATAALILTHNITALIGLPVCVATGWILSSPKCGWRSFFSAGWPAVLGVGLAAFFWWPAMSGRPLTQAEESLTGGYFDFRHHFIEASRFISPGWGFGQSEAAAPDRMSLQIGFPHLLAGLGAVALAFMARRKAQGDDRRRARWVLAGLAIMLGAAFMCGPWAQPLWQFLPLVKYVQFPWRFLGLVVLGAAMCGTAVADRLGATSARAEKFVFLGGFAAILAAYFPYYSQARFVAGDARDHSVARVDAATVDALDAAGLFIPVGRFITTADIREAGEHATSRDDFLPRTVKQKPTHPAATMLLAAGYPVPVWTHPQLNTYRFHLQMAGPVIAELEQFWFPGWQATIDGQPANTTPFGPHAIVSCEVPAGDHAVEFHYAGLPQRQTGFLVSLGALVLAAASFRCLGRNACPWKGGVA